MSTVFIGTIKGNIGFDSVLSESIQSDATITKHPIEVGADIADHIYVNPATITMKVIVGYTTIYDDDPYGTSLSSANSRPQNAYKVLEEIKAAGKTFTVITGMKIWNNMALTALTVDRDATTANVMIADLTLQEVFVVDTAMTVLPAYRLAIPGASSQVNNGQVSTTPQDSSVLYNLFGSTP
jgi:hypothetical protein